MTFFEKAGAFALALWLGLGGRASAQEVVSLQEAMSRAITYDAGLQASGANISAARAGVDQAGRRPNPVLGVEAENFVGTGPYSGLDGSEITLSYSQTLERGGKRDARSSFARSQVDVAQTAREVRRLDLLHQVQRAYAEALGAQARAEAASQRVEVTERLVSSVQARVHSAVDPKSAEYRAEVNLLSAQTQRDQAERQSVIARNQLASLWGGDSSFTLQEPGMEAAQSATPATDGESPDLALYRAAERRAEAAYALERAQASQDPTVSLGVRQFGTGDEVAAIAGLSLPLGIYNRNSGGIERARKERLAAELDRIAAERARQRRINALAMQLEAAGAEAASIERDMLPSAQEALRLTREGYERGAFTYLEVIDAERVLSDLRTQHADAIKSYHLIKADLDRETARFAASLPGEETFQ